MSSVVFDAGRAVVDEADGVPVSFMKLGRETLARWGGSSCHCGYVFMLLWSWLARADGEAGYGSAVKISAWVLEGKVFTLAGRDERLEELKSRCRNGAG